jgi:hypothetical protein
MHINIHPVERVLRVAVGVVMLVLAFVGDKGMMAIWGIGVIPLLTGIVGWCPIYYLLNVNTNRMARVHVDHSKDH